MNIPRDGAISLSYWLFTLKGGERCEHPEGWSNKPVVLVIYIKERREV